MASGLNMMLNALGFDPKEFEEKITSALTFLDQMHKDIAEIKASQLRIEKHILGNSELEETKDEKTLNENILEYSLNGKAN